MEPAVILAEGLYHDPDMGKTAHGLMRFSQRFQIRGVIDSTLTGQDAGLVLDGHPRGIPVLASVAEACQHFPEVQYLILGVVTAGGYLPDAYRTILKDALRHKLHIINGLHAFLSDDPEFSELARDNQTEITDVRKLFRDHKPFFSGKIDEVLARKVAVLGTDSTIGKRTTAIRVHQALQQRGKKSTFVAMGQTGWMQGFPYVIVLDAIINDFVAGAIEDVLWRAWQAETPEFIVTHGEGALLNPGFPGNFELLAAGRPDQIILQHAPGRKHFADFPEYPIPPLTKYLQVIELLTERPPIAITINSEGITDTEALAHARVIEATTGILTRVMFLESLDDIVELLISG